MFRAGIVLISVAGLMSAADPAFERALSQYNRTDYKGAVAALQGHTGSDAAALELLGQALFMDGDFHKATDTLEKAAQLDPHSSSIQTWLGRAWGRRAETSFALSAMGYANKSRTALEKAVELDPSNKAALGDLFDFYIAAPGIVGGGVDKARGLMPLLTRYDPEQVIVAQAQIEEQQKQYASAEAHLRRAAEGVPVKIGHVLNLARFLAQRGRYEESEREFQRAERLAPHSPRVEFARADSYVQTKRNLGEARDLLKQYLSASNLTPDDPPRSEALKLLKKIEGS